MLTVLTMVYKHVPFAISAIFGEQIRLKKRDNIPGVYHNPFSKRNRNKNTNNWKLVIVLNALKAKNLCQEIVR